MNCLSGQEKSFRYGSPGIPAGTDGNEYISDLRMEHARRLLAENTLTVDEIADQCGYRYTSYFIRKFRQHYSESPFRYREKIKKEREVSQN